MMANVSSSNGLEKRPALSFRDDCGREFPSWHRTTLGTIIEPYSEKVHGEHDFEVLTSSREGLQRQIDHFGSQQRHDTDGYNIIPLGFCTYRNRSDDGRFTFNINKISDKAIVSKFYPVFRFKNANSTFMTEYLNSSARARKKLSVLAVGTSQVVLSFEALKSAKFDLPCKEEQDKIASLLECLNERVELQRSFVDALKKYKRGLHKLVFIKNRKHSWEKSALHDIASFCGGGTPSKDISSYWEGEIGWISSSDIQEEWIDDISVTRRITKTAIDNSATKLCPEGTIAIVSRVGVGKVAIMPESLCTSQDFTNITSITGNTHYMAYQIAFRMKLEAMKTQGTSIKGVTADTIKAMVLDIPPLEEQKKIADMLTAFDAYIKRAVCELDLFLAMKKALLQQLFI